MVSDTDQRRGVKVRWAAIGAAVAVTLGGGGIFAVNAASSPASSVITIDPVRILDTRSDLGLAGPFVSGVSQKLQVTGSVPTATGTQIAVPAGATGVLLNVTVVGPTANGFVSVRPGDATGVPSTSSLNFNAGDIVPNSVQVGLPTVGANAGKIDITYDAYGAKGPATEILIDVVGYMDARSTPGVPTMPVATQVSITFTGYDATFNSDDALVGANGCATLNPSRGHLFVPLTVPDGSTIVAVRVRSLDNASAGYTGATTYTLFKVNQGLGQIPVTFFTTVDGPVTDTPMNFGPQSPVNMGNTFYLNAVTSGGLTAQQFCGVTVDYTL